MGIEDNVEFNTALNVESEPRSTEVKFYFNEETESVERVVLDSETDGETTIFPRIIENSDMEYMPNLREIYFAHRDNTLFSDDSGSFYSEPFDGIDFALETSLKRDTINKDFLQFLREELTEVEYARFVIEQIAVRSFLYRNKNRLRKSVYYEHVDNLIMEWPEYYPGEEKYCMEFLPSSNDLRYAYILNKAVSICDNPYRYNLEKEYFTYQELKEIDKGINLAKSYESSPDQYSNEAKLAQKLLDFHDLDYFSKRYSVLDRYLRFWFKIKNSQAEVKTYKEELKRLASWSTKSE
jgi:hypothetical protein